MENWVDFKAVKEAVSMQAILDHYGLSKNLKLRQGTPRPMPDPQRRGD